MNTEFNTANLLVPPHSSNGESAVLGTLLLDNTVLDAVSELVSESDFYSTKHQLIFRAIKSCITNLTPADVISVHGFLERQGHGEAINLQYLNQLAQYVSGSTNIRHYAESVRSTSLLRNLIATCSKITSSCYAPGESTTEQLLANAESEIQQACAKLAPKASFKGLLQLGSDFTDELLRATDGIQPLLVKTGLVQLDDATGGFNKGELIVVAGRPSMGKTALVMGIVEHTALIQEIPVLVISLEMTASALYRRMMASLARIDQTRLSRHMGDLTDNEYAKISEALHITQSATIDFEDAGVETLANIRAAARRAKIRHKQLGLIVIDYLQLLNGDTDSRENRVNEVTEISRGLKLLAKEMRCPVIALSQLNRGVESRPDKRPMMSDLRESGAIEQDADTVMMIYRDEYYTKEACQCPGVAEIIITKQRNGPTGTVRVGWEGATTRFFNI